MNNIKLFYNLIEPKSLWLAHREEEAQMYKGDTDHLKQSLTKLQGHKHVKLLTPYSKYAIHVKREHEKILKTRSRHIYFDGVSLLVLITKVFIQLFLTKT